MKEFKLPSNVVAAIVDKRAPTMSPEAAVLTPLPVAKPELLDEAIAHMERTLRLYRNQRLPESLLGWMLMVNCVRILRAIYGDMLSVAMAMRKKALEQVELEQEAEQALERSTR